MSMISSLQQQQQMMETQSDEAQNLAQNEAPVSPPTSSDDGEPATILSKFAIYTQSNQNPGNNTSATSAPNGLIAGGVGS